MATFGIKIDNFESLSNSLDVGQIFTTMDELKKTTNVANYDSLKYTLSLITTMADVEGNFKTSCLNLFKEATTMVINGFIQPLIDDIKSSKQRDDIVNNKSKILAKWWVNYLSLLDEVYNMKRNNEKWGEDLEIWVRKEELRILEQSIECLKGFHHWKILLLRCLCLKQKLLSKRFEINELNAYYGEIKEYLQRSYVYKELQNAKLSSENKKILAFRSKILQELFNILEDNDNKSENVKEAVLSGRFEKKNHPNRLSHSIIVGDDGGIFALMNSISDEEKLMILEAGQIQNDYAPVANAKNVDNRFKIKIGEGSFGKIRLCVALTKNETSETMKPGQIVCVKKTAHFKKMIRKTAFNYIDIREHTWNDYSVGDVGRLIFSPAVYDMKIIDLYPSIPIEHLKGYSMLQFVAVYDASKVFNQNQKYFDNWVHQRSYLISIFEVISKLLDMGICMTDLKPQNTLYDGENQRGMLIDLAGVVRKPKRKDLETCKLKYIRETTLSYTASEILNAEDMETVVDLCKAMSFSLGKLIKSVVLQETSKNKETAYYKELQSLSEALMRTKLEGENSRISVEDGLHNLRKIGVEKDELKIDFLPLMTALKQDTEKNFGKFGLNPKIKNIEKNFIQIRANKLDPERFEVIDSFDLQTDLDDFLYKSNKENQLVYLLLGTSGSGKSTVLQKKYLEAISKWTPNDPIPLFMNLATETDIKLRWKWLNDQLITGNEMKFTLFSGQQKYPVILFIDSFDEVPTKINYVSSFLEDLGNNPKNKCLICCRTEFIQKDQDIFKWFGVPTAINSYSTTPFVKRYIVPLETQNFDIKQYIEHYYEDQVEDLSPTVLKSQLLSISKKVFERNMALMKTSFMVHLTLEVLPEIISEKNNTNITRRAIYQKYIERKIRKVSQAIRNLVMEMLQMKTAKQFFQFFNESASCLAKILLKIGTSRVIIGNDSKHHNLAKSFFDRLKYSKEIPCLENKILEGVIRGLDLNFEIRGNIPSEQITIGFGHDMIKNYFIVNSIIEECDNFGKNPKGKISDFLGAKLIVEDQVLIKFLAEVVAEPENNKFREYLKEIVFRTKKADSNDFEAINASANAITLLIAANVSFAGMDLSGIKIRGANINDGVFSGSDFTDADLSEVVLDNCKLDHTIFRRTNMQNIRFSINQEVDLQCIVWCVAFSKDGQFFISGSNDGAVKLFDSSTGTLQKTFLGHTELVRSVMFSHDSESLLLISGSGDCTVKIWDRLKGNLVQTYNGHTKTVSTVDCSYDMSLIASGSWDESIIVWERKTGNEVLKIDSAHRRGVRKVLMSKDSSKILSAGDDSRLKLWERTTGKLIRFFEGHSGNINCCCFNRDESFIVSGACDRLIKIWETSTGNLVKTLKGHNGYVTSVILSRDENIILSSGYDGKVKLWEKNSGLEVKNFDRHKKAIYGLAFSPNETCIMSGSEDSTIKLWTFSVLSNLKNYESHQNIVNGVAFSPDSKLFLSCSADKTIKLWNTENGNLLQTFENNNRVNSVTFSKDGNSFIGGLADGTLNLWDRITGKLIRSFKGNHGNCNDILSPDENIILGINAPDEKSMILWDKNTGQELQILRGHNDKMTSAVFSKDGEYILSCSQDKSIILWERKAANFRIKRLEGIQRFESNEIENKLKKPLYLFKYILWQKETAISCQELFLFPDVILSPSAKNFLISLGAVEVKPLLNEVSKEENLNKEQKSMKIFKEEKEKKSMKIDHSEKTVLISNKKAKKTKKCSIF